MKPMFRMIVTVAIAVIGVSLCVSVFIAQTPVDVQRTAPMINASSEPQLAPFRFRSLGPAGPGGRIHDIAVSESDPNIIYVAYATGGLFKSSNNGTTFEPVFETYGSASFGDVAIHPTNPNIVYAGTGEANNRQTSSFGDGIYKTTDGGKTWTNIGLKETQTIGRVVIDPKNPETIYVAANGHLFGPNPDRGVYKTTNGGQTWNKVKYVDEDTGFTDIVLDPSVPNIVYAASYQRRRSGCCFNGGGPGSALWKSENAGQTWTKLTGNGLPAGTYGRIAIDVARSNPNVVYAQIETGAAEGGGDAPEGGGNRGGFDWCNNGAPAVAAGRGGRGGAASQTPPALDPTRSGLYRSDDKGHTWHLVSNCNSRPLYFSEVNVDPQNANTVYVAGTPVYMSLDGGKTFAALARAGGNGEPSHVDTHGVWIDPKNSKHLLLSTDGGLNITWDQGKNWEPVMTMSTGLSYWVSADMRRPYYVYTGMQDNGGWGGPSATRSYEAVIPNSAWFGISPGDGFQTAADPTDYNIIYTESQEGNASRYDLRTGAQKSIKPTAGGVGGRGAPAATAAPGTCIDGRIIAVSGRGGRGGAGGANAAGNVLNAEPGDQYRFNWNTPYMLSPHDPHIVWFGGNRLFKSYNRGDTYTASADLTKQVDRCKISLMGVDGDKPQLSKNDGVTSYSTVISISESPVTPGVVWAGTDDGNLQLSRDGGRTFTELSRNLPGLPPHNDFWISRIDASHFETGRAYVAVDGHRSDDLTPHVFVTQDYGQTFRNISSNLPRYGNVQVVREDPKNKDLLYVGTEFGLFISLDAGESWKKFMNNFPTVRTDDVLVHPRDGDLIVATHGRGVWIADDVTPLQQLSANVMLQDAYLFDVRPAVAYQRDIQTNRCRPTLPCLGQHIFAAENAPRGTAINYYLKSAASGDVKISITDITGRVLCTSDGPKNAGINRVQWTLSATGANGTVPNCSSASGEAVPGTYAVQLSIGGKNYTKAVQVLEDRWLSER